ncbi:MAG TPA: SCE4755 family polysaccharide monooxygenase-like protein [Polyangia bacterium]|nr:SCE4755 family polysaccharide monooxygenase-like protein [Polyangia bacterium]
MHARRLAFLVPAIAAGYSVPAHAHFQLIEPPAVVESDPNGKGSPPCGPDVADVAMPTAVQGGHPLKLNIKETVRHGGFYRFALAFKSRSEFPPDNVVYDSGNRILPPNGTVPKGSDGQSDHADSQKPPVFPVIADDVWDHPQAGPMPITFPSTMYPDEVMLPNVNCDRCILQVIEFMHPHGFNPPAGVSGPQGGGGYFYHHCAELKITADPTLPLFVPGADGGVADAGRDDAATDKPTSTGGTTGSDGSAATGGSTGAAGEIGSGGNPGSAGVTGGGGASASGGSTGGSTGVAGNAGGSQAGTGGSTSGGGKSSGGCSIASTTDVTPQVGLIILGALGLSARRRRRR